MWKLSVSRDLGSICMSLDLLLCYQVKYFLKEAGTSTLGLSQTYYPFYIKIQKTFLLCANSDEVGCAVTACQDGLWLLSVHD